MELDRKENVNNVKKIFKLNFNFVKTMTSEGSRNIDKHKIKIAKKQQCYLQLYDLNQKKNVKT